MCPYRRKESFKVLALRELFLRVFQNKLRFFPSAFHRDSQARKRTGKGSRVAPALFFNRSDLCVNKAFCCLFPHGNKPASDIRIGTVGIHAARAVNNIVNFK